MTVDLQPLTHLLIEIYLLRQLVLELFFPQHRKPAKAHAILHSMAVIRNRYTFTRPLTADEAELLRVLISWRCGSSVVTVGDVVVGAVCHPDDVALFEKRLHRRGCKVQAMQLQS
jgi:hypothetical protein